MEGITFLTVLSGAMLMGSYIAGSVPLLFDMSKSRLRLVSIFGAGLLVGTALSVIIPEGVEALYNAQSDSARPAALHDARHLLEASASKDAELPRLVPQGAELPNSIKKQERRSVDIPADPARVKRHDHGTEGSHSHSEHNHDHGGIHKKIGFSLVFGFVFMLVVDQISSKATTRNDRDERWRLGISATIGLVVHAAADGIALGSASTINKADVQLIVFIAIMLHKAPAAFGLVAFLLNENIDKRRIKKHLLVFSFAAPVAALVTFIIIQNSGETLASSESNTGVLMLFSAGTFLYVATVHVLPELAAQSETTQDYSLVIDSESLSQVGHAHSGGSFTMKEMCSIIAGALVPAVLASGHSH